MAWRKKGQCCCSTRCVGSIYLTVLGCGASCTPPNVYAGNTSSTPGIGGVAGATITITHQDDGSAVTSGTTDANGFFMYSVDESRTPPHPCVYSATISAPGYATRTLTVTFSPNSGGGPYAYNMCMCPSRIKVCVVGCGGSFPDDKLVGATVTVYNNLGGSGDTVNASGVTGADGCVTLDVTDWCSPLHYAIVSYPHFHDSGHQPLCLTGVYSADGFGGGGCFGSNVDCQFYLNTGLPDDDWTCCYCPEGTPKTLNVTVGGYSCPVVYGAGGLASYYGCFVATETGYDLSWHRFGDGTVANPYTYGRTAINDDGVGWDHLVPVSFCVKVSVGCGTYSSYAIPTHSLTITYTGSQLGGMGLPDGTPCNAATKTFTEEPDITHIRTTYTPQDGYCCSDCSSAWTCYPCGALASGCFANCSDGTWHGSDTSYDCGPLLITGVLDNSLFPTYTISI